jgi:glycosyltransferase involved in cell wall biosynthesis
MADKKIIVANYRYYVSGGPEVYMFKFMEKCENIGYKPIPFSVKYSQNEATEYEKYFISSRGGDSVYYDQIKKTPRSIYKTLQGAFYNSEAVKQIKKLIKVEKPEVLYALQVINTLSPSIFKAAKKQGLKVVHRISDFNLICPKSDLLLNNNTCNLCVKGNLNYGIKNRCYHNSKFASIIRCESMKFHRRTKLYKYVDYFITPTDFTRNKLIEGGFPADKVVKVPTFIDSSKIIPCYEHKNYVLFLGRLVPEKGAKYAIEAMTYLKDMGLKLKVTGNLSDRDTEIKEIIDSNGLQDIVEFVGFKRGQELSDLIQNCMCVLCPAIWYENMPNTVIEAYAYGKPVIASNMGCFPELIDNDNTGFLFEPKNSKELADKIQLLVYENRYIDMGKRARAKVERDFSPEKHLEKLKELFEN